MQTEIPTLLFLEQTDSTNRELWRMLDAGKDLNDGFAVQTGFQTAGRGQGSMSWVSKAGKNLLCSVLLKPQFLHPAKQFLVNKCFALAIREALSQIDNQHVYTIKWPNDIYCVDKKIAGTLIENRILGNTLELCVAGIGININQRSFPAEIPNPTSLAILNQKDYNIRKCLEYLLGNIMKFYSLLKQNKTEIIDQAYLNHLLGYKQPMKFMSEGKAFRARLEGVNDHGKLILQDTENNTREFGMKEVEFLL